MTFLSECFYFLSILECYWHIPLSFPPTVPTFHTAHARSRPRLERELEYDVYTDRDSYPHNSHNVTSHLNRGDEYRDRDLDRNLERIPPREHRTNREEEYPHRSSSRRVLNAI